MSCLMTLMDRTINNNNLYFIKNWYIIMKMYNLSMKTKTQIPKNILDSSLDWTNNLLLYYTISSPCCLGCVWPCGCPLLQERNWSAVGLQGRLLAAVVVGAEKRNVQIKGRGKTQVTFLYFLLYQKLQRREREINKTCKKRL